MMHRKIDYNRSRRFSLAIRYIDKLIYLPTYKYLSYKFQKGLCY